jgi:hypothetical protein
MRMDIGVRSSGKTKNDWCAVKVLRLTQSGLRIKAVGIVILVEVT